MSHVTGARISPDVCESIRLYLCHRQKTSVMSTSEALKSVRLQVPQCQLSDRYIILLAVERAIEAGFAVNFDGVGPPV